MPKRNPDVKEAIVAFVAAYHLANGYAPSIREIGAAVGKSSTSTICRHLDDLEKAGRIRRGGSGKNRAIAVVMA